MIRKTVFVNCWIFIVIFITACVKQDYFGSSNLKQVLYFHIPGQIGKSRIEEDNLKIYVTMPSSANLTSLAPDSILTSTFATIEPRVGQSQDFSRPVLYKVMAEDKSLVMYEISIK